MTIAAKLQELGIHIDTYNAPAANYTPAVCSGGLLFTAGQTPKQAGQLLYTGQLGATASNKDGYEAARICAINSLAILNHYANGLDNIARIVKITVFINATADFTGHSAVADGATDLLVAVFGDAGLPARSAVGVASLPNNATCEVEMVAELKDDEVAASLNERKG